ncbi:MAG: hypothetical protein EOP61_10815 [Sphingomonadales bacterium]|nr:MAG: hypothetical protein EOP61_10815 [Sphingomonadales bacterium]
MSKPPAPVVSPMTMQISPIYELLDLLQSVRSEAKDIVADPQRRKSVWTVGGQVSLAEAEEEIALGRTILWLLSHGAGWLEIRTLISLYGRLEGNSGQEALRRQYCRIFLLTALEELSSTRKGFGPDRKQRREGADWLAKRLPRELGSIFEDRKTRPQELGGAIYNLHRRANRALKSPMDEGLPQAVHANLVRHGLRVYDGTPWRHLPRVRRAELLLAWLREAVPA